MNTYSDLEKLKKLKDEGVISEEEFQYEKQRILNSQGYSYFREKKSNGAYLALMHLSQFAGLIICGFGFLLPIILWVVRSEDEEINEHGKNIMNFMLSMLIYTIILIPLCFLLIGIPFLALLLVLEVVFVIVATIKAANSEYWEYPLSITFIS